MVPTLHLQTLTLSLPPSPLLYWHTHYMHAVQTQNMPLQAILCIHIYTLFFPEAVMGSEGTISLHAVAEWSCRHCFPAEWVEALDQYRLRFIESILEVTRFFEYTQLSPTDWEVIFQSRFAAGPLKLLQSRWQVQSQPTHLSRHNQQHTTRQRIRHQQIHRAEGSELLTQLQTGKKTKKKTGVNIEKFCSARLQISRQMSSSFMLVQKESWWETAHMSLSDWEAAIQSEGVIWSVAGRKPFYTSKDYITHYHDNQLVSARFRQIPRGVSTLARM